MRQARHQEHVDLLLKASAQILFWYNLWLLLACWHGAQHAPPSFPNRRLNLLTRARLQVRTRPHLLKGKMAQSLRERVRRIMC